MIRVLMGVLAATPLVVMVLVQPHIALAHNDMGFTSRSPVQLEVMMAYVDPGAAGFIIVSVLGFISAVGYTARGYVGKLKRMVMRREVEVHKDESQVADADG